MFCPDAFRSTGVFVLWAILSPAPRPVSNGRNCFRMQCTEIHHCPIQSICNSAPLLDWPVLCSQHCAGPPQCGISNWCISITLTFTLHLAMEEGSTVSHIFHLSKAENRLRKEMRIIVYVCAYSSISKTRACFAHQTGPGQSSTAFQSNYSTVPQPHSKKLLLFTHLIQQSPPHMC